MFLEGYVLNMRLDRLRKRARTLCLMQTYFGLWRSKIEAKQEAKDEQDASQVSKPVTSLHANLLSCNVFAEKFKDYAISIRNSSF